MTLRAYCMDWHLKNSDAFRYLLTEALKSRLDITLADVKEWKETDSKQPVIFCQVMPPDKLLSNPDAKVVWLPMWDNVHQYSQAWWDSLPKHLRVVCFSRAVYAKANRAGLCSLSLTYFKNPSEVEQVEWTTRRLFYWNRVGLARPEFLHKLCLATRAEELIFRPRLDPGTPADRYYELPKQLAGTQVRQIAPDNRRSYWDAINSANIFIAPRPYEGAGMTFLEAMARGAVVMASNAPTMNEYILHRQNGYLFDSPDSTRPYKQTLHLARRLLRKPMSLPALPMRQDWAEIGRLDWRALAQRARDDHDEGFRRWEDGLDTYAQFLTRW